MFSGGGSWHSLLHGIDSSVLVRILVGGPGQIVAHMTLTKSHVCRIPPMILDCIFLLLVCFKSYEHYRSLPQRTWRGTRLMNVLVRDSVFYFFTCAPSTPPSPPHTALTAPQRVLDLPLQRAHLEQHARVAERRRGPAPARLDLGDDLPARRRRAPRAQHPPRVRAQHARRHRWHWQQQRHVGRVRRDDVRAACAE